MATTYTTEIEQLYVAYFHRPADASGLAYWQTILERSGSTAAVSAAFAASTEYKDNFAKLSAHAVINQIYQNLFGRSAEASGLYYWSGLLSSKTLSIDNIVKNIADGAQGSDLVAFANKVKGAGAFTAALDTLQEIEAYRGESANQYGKAFIQSITTDASLAKALLKENLDAAIASIWAPPKMDTLTKGADTFTSGATDFHFSAPLTPTGNTLQNGDSITAGAGSGDRLDARLGNLDSAAVSLFMSGVETIAIEAVGRLDLGLFEQPAVTVSADGVLGATSWVSDNSSTDLVIDLVDIRPEQRTRDISIVMRDTGPGDVDFSVYFKTSALREFALANALTNALSNNAGATQHALVPIAIQPQGKSTATIVLDHVGRGGLGGDLVVGNQAQFGVDRFEIEVGRNSALQTISSTSNYLSEVVIKNGPGGADGVPGNLQVKGQMLPYYDLLGPVPSTALTVIGNDFYGFKDVRLIDASAMKGTIAFSAQITAGAVAKYAIGGAPDYFYSGGANNDSIYANIESPVLESGAHFSANGGAGNDTLTVTNVGVDQLKAQQATVNVNGGDGADAIYVGMAAVIDGGRDNDTITLGGLGGSRVVFGAGFGNDRVTNFRLGDAGADKFDFSALGGRGSAFAGSAISNTNLSITVQRESAVNDSAADIAALYTDGASASSHVFLAYDGDGTAKVYSVNDGAGSGVVATLVGSVALGLGFIYATATASDYTSPTPYFSGIDWATATAANFY